MSHGIVCMQDMNPNPGRGIGVRMQGGSIS